jgi:hypothetical protein
LRGKSGGFQTLGLDELNGAPLFSVPFFDLDVVADHLGYIGGPLLPLSMKAASTRARLELSAGSADWWNWRARARSQRPAFSIAIWRIISTPYLEILVCLEYNVARTVARKGGGKPADRKSDFPGVSTCLRGCYVPLGDSR